MIRASLTACCLLASDFSDSTSISLRQIQFKSQFDRQSCNCSNTLPEGSKVAAFLKSIHNNVETGALAEGN